MHTTIGTILLAMCSHNSVNGIPAHMSKELMTDIIRGEWNHSNVFFGTAPNGKGSNSKGS